MTNVPEMSMTFQSFFLKYNTLFGVDDVDLKTGSLISTVRNPSLHESSMLCIHCMYTYEISFGWGSQCDINDIHFPFCSSDLGQNITEIETILCNFD